MAGTSGGRVSQIYRAMLNENWGDKIKLPGKKFNLLGFNSPQLAA